MYCKNDKCSNFAPCSLHSKITTFEYEVRAMDAEEVEQLHIRLGFPFNPIHSEVFYAREAFVFKSHNMDFYETCEFHGRPYPICDLCHDDICFEDVMVINNIDSCVFHEDCLCYYLHRIYPSHCPGCKRDANVEPEKKPGCDPVLHDNQLCKHFADLWEDDF